MATTASPNKCPDGMSKLDFMKKLGADEVINYKEAEWSEADKVEFLFMILLRSCCQVLAGKDYDLIYDCVGTPEDWPKASKVLKKGGRA